MNTSVPAPVRRAGTRRRRRRTAAWNLVAAASTVVLALAAAAFLFLAVGPRILGYQTSTMLTASMSPLINPGDVVVSVPVPLADLHAGDVITYHIPVYDHRVETHRIIDVRRGADGSTSVRTKGDANDAADPWTAVLQGDHVYRHAFTVPGLGAAIRTLRQPAVMNSLMYGAPAVLVAGGLMAIWRKPRHTEGRRDACGEAGPAVLEPSRFGELALDLDEEAASAFLASYLQMLPGRVGRIVQALYRKDSQASLDAVLSLKISSAMAGALHLERRCAGLERQLRAGAVPHARLAETELTRAMRSVLAARPQPAAPEPKVPAAAGVG